MAHGPFRLGVDFGSSNTAAVLAPADGTTPPAPLVFDGSPLLPSAVFAAADGTLLAGADAVHAARSAPEAFEPHPKRRIDEGTVLLGAAEVTVADLIAAVLSRVAAEARRVAGEDPAEVVLTCPADWGAPRRAVLARAAASVAGWPVPGLVPEPAAAAAWFAAEERLPAGSAAVVYDFGAGTFDVSVVRRDTDGFTVLGTAGRPDTGGLDIDEAVVSGLRRRYRQQSAAWPRLLSPATPDEHRRAWEFRRDVRTAKEMLSRAASAPLHVPGLDDVLLGREEFEDLARPVLDRTVSATKRAIAAAGAEPSMVFLVGGSSRVPLATTMLHRALGIAPTTVEQPELVVAQGALLSEVEPAPPPVVVAHEPVAAAPVAEEPQPEVPLPVMRQRPRYSAWAALFLTLIGIPLLAWAASSMGGKPGADRGDPGASDSAPPAMTVPGAVGPTAVLDQDRAVALKTDAEASGPVQQLVTRSTDKHVLAVVPELQGPLFAGLPASQYRSRILDVTTNTELGSIAAPGVLSPDGRLAAGVDGNVVRLYDAGNARELARLDNSGDALRLGFNTDGTRIAALIGEQLRVWDTAAHGQVHTVPALGARTFALGPGDLSATWTVNSEVTVHNGSTAAGTWTTRSKPSKSGGTLAFSPDGTVLATGSDTDGWVEVWSLAAGHPALGPPLSLKAAGYELSTAIAFGPDGRTLAIADTSGRAGLATVDGTATTLSDAFDGPQGDNYSAVLIGPDNRLLAASRHTVHSWLIAAR